MENSSAPPGPARKRDARRRAMKIESPSDLLAEFKALSAEMEPEIESPKPPAPEPPPRPAGGLLTPKRPAPPVPKRPGSLPAAPKRPPPKPPGFEEKQTERVELNLGDVDAYVRNADKLLIHEDSGNVDGSTVAVSRRKELQKEEVETQKEKYQMFVGLANAREFPHFDKMQFLFPSGYDKEGRPIVVLVGKYLPAKTAPLDELFLYVIKVLDRIVERNYTVVYIATGQTSANRPPFQWLYKVYTTVDRRYKKNMKKLYIVNSSSWLRSIMSLFKPFLSKKVWQKVINVQGINAIFDHISAQQLKIPTRLMAEIMDHKPLFGAPLAEVCENPQHSVAGLPNLVSNCIQHLFEHSMHIEGIFRIPGDRTTLNRMKIMFDEGKPVDLSATDIYTVGSLLKLFLRELPDPLFTYALFDEFVESQDTSLSPEEKFTATSAALQKLPKPNKMILFHLMFFLIALSDNCAINKMTTENIAVCFAPTLIWRPVEDSDPLLALTDLAATNSLVKFILEHKEILPIPE